MNQPEPTSTSFPSRLAGALSGLRSWLRAEATDVKASVDELTTRADADLSRKERELEASPSERIEMIQAETSGDDLLDEVRRRIEE